MDIVVIVVLSQVDLLTVLAEDLDVEAQGLQLLDQDLERLRARPGVGTLWPLTMAS